MLEIQGELPFKVGAYRRGAESIAHAPSTSRAAYRDGQPAAAGRRGQGDRREAGRAGRHRPAALLRAAATGRAAERRDVCCRCPASARARPASCGARAASRRSTISRRPRLRAGCATCKGMSAKTEQRLLDGLKELRKRPPQADAPGHGRRTSSSASIRALEPARRGRRGHAGRLVPPAARDRRRHRPAGRDRPTRRRSSQRLHEVAVGRARRRLRGRAPAARRAPPSSCCAARRST